VIDDGKALARRLAREEAPSRTSSTGNVLAAIQVQSDSGWVPRWSRWMVDSGLKVSEHRCVQEQMNGPEHPSCWPEEQPDAG